MLKADLHIHTKEDPIDKDKIDYSAKKLIDKAVELNYDIIAITCHDYVLDNEEIKEYAKKKDILLLTGAEVTINGKHTLVYNITNEERLKINSFDDLKELKKNNNNIFVIAPHPFFIKSFCLGKEVIKNKELFDAWEYSFFYTKLINLNRKAIKLAKKYNKPIVANSDLHNIEYFNRIYTLIDTEKKDKESIFNAIKNNKVKIISKPLKLKEMIKIFFDMFRK